MEAKTFGVGIDIESVDRFENLDLIKDSLLLNRIFTENELKYCFSKKNAAPHLAVRYAGKEAVIKALSGMGKVNPSYNEVEILNDENGLPVVKINNRNIRNVQTKISLSHCEDKAVAFVIVTGG